MDENEISQGLLWHEGRSRGIREEDLLEIPRWKGQVKRDGKGAVREAEENQESVRDTSETRGAPFTTLPLTRLPSWLLPSLRSPDVSYDGFHRAL